MGGAGAAWVRVADELASVSADYDGIVGRLRGAFASQGGDAAARKLDEFGQWLQAVSLGAAGNGERAEQAAVAYGIAVAAMPSVSQAVAARTTQQVMSSLAAYNGAVLNGQFAEFDEQANATDASAAAAMYQYEDACSALAAPWDQPVAPEVTDGDALQTEQRAKADAAAERERANVGGGHAAVASMPVVLAAFRASAVKSSDNAPELAQVRATAATGTPSGSGSGMGPMGGYGPMGGFGRSGGQGREHQSSLSGSFDDDEGGSGASLSAEGMSWLPAAAPSEAPFVVSDVSWGASTSVFDELAVPDGLDSSPYAEEPERALEQVSNQWVAPPVLGVDKGLTL